MKKQKSVTMSFRTNEEQAERLQLFADETRMSCSEIIRQIIDSALLIERPVIVSNFQQPIVLKSRRTKTHRTG